MSNAKTKKATVHKTVTPTPRNVEQRFYDLTDVYGTDDPEVIKQKIMFRNITVLVNNLVTPGNRNFLNHDITNFELCNQFIEHEGNIHSALMCSSDQRLKNINALLIELHKLFAGDHRDDCKTLIPSSPNMRYEYNELREQVNKIYATLV